MPHFYIANVGTNDIRFHTGGPDWHGLGVFKGGIGQDESGAGAVGPLLDIPAGELGARAIGRALWERYDELRASIRAPFLEALFDHDGPYPDAIVLCYTDQNDSRHNHDDTIYVARLLQRWLADHHPQVAAQVEGAAIQGNPTRFEATYPFYGVLLSTIKGRMGKGDHVSVGLSAGVPTANTALMIQAVNVFGKDVTLLRFAPEPGNSARSIVVRETGERLRLDALRAQLFHALDRHDFAAAADMLKAEGLVGDGWERVFRYAAARQSFAFTRACELLRDLPAMPPDVRRWRKEAQDIAADATRQLAEMWRMTDACQMRQDYSGFLWRAVTFDDNALRLAAEKALPQLKRCYTGKTGRLDCAKLQTEYPGLDWPKKNSNKPMVLSILDWIDLIQAAVRVNETQQGGRTTNENLQEVVKLVRSHKDLADLRNQMIHLMGGISLDELKRLKGSDPGQVVRDQRKMLTLLTGAEPHSTDPYDDLIRAAKTALSPAGTAVDLHSITAD